MNPRGKDVTYSVLSVSGPEEDPYEIPPMGFRCDSPLGFGRNQSGRRLGSFRSPSEGYLEGFGHLFS